MKTAVVTAGAAGLGRAMVEHLAGAGWRVVASRRTSVEAARAIEEAHPAVRFVAADLGTEAGREALADAAGPQVDLLLNNLGVYPEAFVEDIDTGTFERVFGLTCTAGFDLVKRLGSRIPPGGRIVFIGDSGADRIEARPQATPYHIAKLGVHVLVRTFAQRLGGQGITVNMISPGFLENSVGEPGEPIPLGGPVSFTDLLSALDFILSEGAGQISGANILVNGAWNLG